MFDTHQPMLAQIGADSPAGFAAVAKLAVLSAQAPFARMDKALRGAARRDFAGVSNVTATKRLGCAWLDANAARLHRRLHRVWLGAPRGFEADAMMYLMACPGLGMVKAGFAAQMLLGVAGCLDTHNLTRLGLDPLLCVPGAFNTRARWTRLYRYLYWCERLGGARGLWNDWCVWVAQTAPTRWPDPFSVSAWHVEVVDGNPLA